MPPAKTYPLFAQPLWPTHVDHHQPHLFLIFLLPEVGHKEEQHIATDVHAPPVATQVGDLVGILVVGALVGLLVVGVLVGLLVVGALVVGLFVGLAVVGAPVGLAVVGVAGF